MSSNEWQLVKIGEICDVNQNSYTTKENWKYINYLDTGNITEGKIENIQFLDTTTDKIPSRAKRKVYENDIIYSTVRPNQKHYGIIKKPLDNMLVSTGFAVINGKIDKVDNNFLYYYLTQQHIVDMLHTIAEHSTSAYPSIKPSDIENINALIPRVYEQKAIAATLSCLDDKIELNNRINKNLEEMARTIFKSWFVDFEPFQDGEFEDSELGMIPKGWAVAALEDKVDSIDNRGKTPPLSSKLTPFPIIDVKALSGSSRIIDFNNCTKYVEEGTYDNWFRSGHPRQHDILISTVGSLAEMKIFYGNKGCIAQNVVGFRSKGLSPLYLYQYLQNIKQDLISYNIGSVQPSIKVTHIIKHKILIPDEKALNLFDVTINVISNMIFENSIEIQKLIEVRDPLLPKLMSGEIRVPVEEVK
ncbi:MAG: restriction endonuclease subunit S [Clostridiaceae bacterium]